MAAAASIKDTFSLAGFARVTHDKASTAAETARRTAYDEYWNTALDRFKIQFPEGVVYLYVTARSDLELIRGQFADLFCLAPSYEDCLEAARKQISEDEGDAHWEAIAVSLRGYGTTMPTATDSFPIKVDGRHYWFQRWNFEMLEAWLKKEAMAAIDTPP